MNVIYIRPFVLSVVRMTVVCVTCNATLAMLGSQCLGNWKEVRTIPSPGLVTGLAHDGTKLFAAGFTTNKIHALDPASGAVLYEIPAPGAQLEGLAFDGTHLWAASFHANTIYELDPLSGNILHSVASPASAENGLAWYAGSLYVNDTYSSRIYQTDPVTGAPVNSLSFPAGSSMIGGGITFVESQLYWSDGVTGIIYILDPHNGNVLDSFDSEIMNGDVVGIEGMTHGAGSLFISTRLDDGSGDTIHVFVPEPSTFIMVAIGLAGLLAWPRKKDQLSEE